MAKFHINSKGVPAPCRVTKGNCPFGGEESHFDSIEAAQKYVSAQNEEKFGLTREVKRKIELAKIDDELINEYDVNNPIEGIALSNYEDSGGSEYYLEMINEGKLGESETEIRKNLINKLEETLPVPSGKILNKDKSSLTFKDEFELYNRQNVDEYNKTIDNLSEEIVNVTYLSKKNSREREKLVKEIEDKIYNEFWEKESDDIEARRMYYDSKPEVSDVIDYDIEESKAYEENLDNVRHILTRTFPEPSGQSKELTQLQLTEIWNRRDPKVYENKIKSLADKLIKLR